MFNKNNLRYILILAIGFFWCSSLYLTQEQYLTKYATTNFVNISELLFGSLSMAIGILIFGLMYRKNKNMKMYYIIFTLLALVSSISFFATKNKYVMSVCLSLTCLFGTAGFGAGYHFSLLSQNVLKEYRGRVFAIGYGLGSIGTYLMVLLPKGFYSSIKSLIIYIPFILINLFLILKKGELNKIEKEEKSKTFNKYLLRVSIIIFAMSLLSALSTDAIAIETINISGGYGDSRIWYCIGLLIAGILVDKKTSLFEIMTIVSFVFSLLAIILLKDGYSIKIIAGLSYTFVAFFVLFRTMSFVNIIDHKKNYVWLAAFGLMYSRIMEALMVLFEDKLISNYTLLIIIISIVLSIVIVLYFLLYFKNVKENENNIIKELSIKYNLSSQEEKVLTLLLLDKSNQEMADELFLSVNTIRNHVASIYKKTNMKKKELKEKYYYRTN